MTNITNEQLEAWASLGPWQALGTDPAEGVDCFWIKGQPNPAMRGFSDEIASVNGSQNDPKRQTNAALIAAAPALAAALLAERKAREVEVAEWKENTIAFLGPWAVEYAKQRDYPDGHIHHVHYDLLEKAGARLVSFTRHEPQKDQPHD